MSVIGDKAEQAHRRGDALERRRLLMEAWGNFIPTSCTSELTGSSRSKLMDKTTVMARLYRMGLL